MPRDTHQVAAELFRYRLQEHTNEGVECLGAGVDECIQICTYMHTHTCIHTHTHTHTHTPAHAR